MEHLYEDLVCWKLTRDPLVFATRQYNIGNRHSCADIVALNVRSKEVWIVEVTTSANAVNLAKKVVDRDKQWIQQLRQMLIVGDSPVDETWRYKVKAFIRKDAENAFRRIIGEPVSDDH